MRTITRESATLSTEQNRTHARTHARTRSSILLYIDISYLDQIDMARGGFYAVTKGREVGIFTSWEDGAKPQVAGFSGAKFKKFASKLLAEAYLMKNKEKNDDELPDIGALSIAANAHEPIASKCYEREETAKTERPDPRDQDTLVAFCDGSGLSNGKPDCRAGYAAVFPHSKDWNVAKEIEDGDRATNERADCYAVLEAMKRANGEDPKQDLALVIFTNHLNVINSMTQWIDKWHENGWLRAKKKPVENRDLFEKLWAAQGKRRIVWVHINTKKEMSAWEEEWSGKADQLAREAARGSP